MKKKNPTVDEIRLQQNRDYAKRCKKSMQLKIRRQLQERYKQEFLSKVYVWNPYRDVEEERIKEMYNLKPIGTKIEQKYDYRPVYVKPEVVNENDDDWEYVVKAYSTLKPIERKNTMSIDLKSLSERMKKYRKYSFKSQKTLAAEIKTSASKISQIERMIPSAKLSIESIVLFEQLVKRARYAAVKWAFKIVWMYFKSLPKRLYTKVRGWFI